MQNRIFELSYVRILCLLLALPAAAHAEPVYFQISDQFGGQQVGGDDYLQDERVTPTQFQFSTLPRPITTTFPRSRSTPRTSTTAPRYSTPLAGVGPSPIGLGSLKPTRPITLIQGREGRFRLSTDIGSLLDLSPSAIGTQAQKRTPITSDTRVRSSKVGALKASGSHWVPARMDLDTMLSKLDSRTIQDVAVIKGPYSVQLGPGFNFVDVTLPPSPRFSDGFGSGGTSSVDYKTNGEQWYGRQTVVGGNASSGFRLGYGHRTGNDYTAGNGQEMPSSYKSRDIEFAYGMDLGESSSLEFTALRLDQTDVEFPGQIFDIDFLVTDGYEVTYQTGDLSFADLFLIESWYNQTRLEGNAQTPAKRQQFPVLDTLFFTGHTNVDSLSTGYKTFSKYDMGNGHFLVGTDLRFVKQQLDEVTDGGNGPIVWTARNSPIPKSHQTNPGLFVERQHQIGNWVTSTSGGRIDWVSSNIESPQDYTDIGVRGNSNEGDVIENPLSIGQILGTNDFAQEETLYSIFQSLETQLTSSTTATLSAGYSERAPTLTELYAAEPFIFVLQNGLNTVTGDPLLKKERLWQVDAEISYESLYVRSGVGGFHSWIRDYITFENMSVENVNGAQQINLKFVNTELATLVGAEAYVEVDVTNWLTPFATLSYVDGRDRTRNGEFATVQARHLSVGPSLASSRDANQPRGNSGGILGSDQEPLPGISPIEARLGLRFHAPGDTPRYGGELSVRVVGEQDRVATSLLESTTPGFAVFDLRGFWQFADRMLCVCGIENIADTNYREHLDFRSTNPLALTTWQPGVNFYCGTELNY